ncbi:MAG: selenocysteine-specific translation elongation factor [Alphaproteobacteria bacterium]|jgi:selenocysteine-specific elongation factor|nr:selenocysteine-specific translation elongation factor [Alphaproteobacteria bacterium]
MAHVVYGTAGHIDHGKTTLVRALTGVDCDRLPEERERGITIDLGFARMEHDDTVLHFVDVPGHERLVHTMIAGASGIDLALLVVAADEGVMPQTLEHMEVIRLMGVPGGAVAVTKADLVDDETAEFAAEEIRDHLQGTPFETVPIVAVSAATGAGLDELRRTLVGEAVGARPRQIDARPYREAVDRVFSLAGAGTVVTGTSQWGRLALGDAAVLHPGGREVRVRRLQVHGEERNEVEAGERVAANLAGLGTDEVERGQQLLSAGPWRPTRLVTVSLELLRSAITDLDEGAELEVHALAARSAARVDRLLDRPLAPGHTAVAQLSLEDPMMLFPGDRFVLRRPAPVNTFAGGVVLDAQRSRVRRRDIERLRGIPGPERSAWTDMLLQWIEGAGFVAPDQNDLAARLGVRPEALEPLLGRLLTEGCIVALSGTPPRFLVASALEELKSRADAELSRRLAGQEVSSGVPARDFVASILPRAAEGLVEVFQAVLRERNVIHVHEGRVLPPGAGRHMTEKGAELARAVEQLYREAELNPPPPDEVAGQLAAKPAMVSGICDFLVQQGVLVKLDGKWLIHADPLQSVAERVAAWEVDDFAVGDFKDAFGLTRKLAIPMLEWLDARRVTVRMGNRRKIIRRRQ